MTKKILVLSSSPRRGGNSDTLCDEFMRGAIDNGNEVEKVFLRDKTIHPCMGFLDCLENPTVKGTLFGGGVWHVGEIKGNPKLNEAYEMGKLV